MATTMDHTNQLLHRNAELQTELRLVKEQLDQAHKSTNYLLERMSRAETPCTNIELQQLQKEHDYVIRENAHLKAILVFTADDRLPTSRRTGSRTSCGVRGTLRSGRDRSPAYTYHQASDDVASEQGNLLDLEDESSPSPTATPADTTPLEPPSPTDESDNEIRHFSDIPDMVGRPVRHRKSGNSSVGLDVSGTTSFDSLETETSEANARVPSRPFTTRKAGFTVYDSNGNPSFFHIPSPKFVDVPTGPRNERLQPLGLPRPFAHHEHTRLMGAATFIEDMDEAEQEEHWAEYGRDNPRHTAEEWKTYYIEKIRPAHLAKHGSKSEDHQEGAGKGKEREDDAQTTQKEKDELVRLPETSFTSSSTNPDEILLDDEEETVDLIDSSFNNTTAVSGGVTLPEDEEIAPNDEETSAEAHRDSMDADPALQSESILKAASASAPAFNSLSLSIHADSTVLEDSRHGSVGSADQAEHVHTKHEATYTLEKATPNGETKPKNPWSFGPAYDQSLLEARAFLDAATPRGQRPSESSKSRFQDAGEEDTIAPPAPSFGTFIIDQDGPGETPPPRTRCAFSRTYFPTTPNNLFYIPAANDPDAHRTVLLSNIPPTTTLAQVLHQIHNTSSPLFSSTYHETSKFQHTTPPLTTNTISLTFLTGPQAAQFVSYTKSHPLSFESSPLDPPVKAIITLLPTPTRPIPPRLLHQAIPAGLTRVLYLHNLPRHLKDPSAVLAKLQELERSVAWPLEAGYDEDGVLVLEYASMMEAEMVWMVVEGCEREFGGVGKGFLGDPCAGFGKGKAKGGDEGVGEYEGGGEDVAGLEMKLLGESEGEENDAVVGGGGEGEMGEMVEVEREEDR